MTVQLKPLPADRFDAWRDDVKQRLVVRSQESGMRVGADAIDFAETFLHELLPQGYATTTTSVFTIVDGSSDLGTIWLGVSAGRVYVIDLGIAAATTAEQREGLFSALRRVADEAEVTRISIALFPQDAEGHALIGDRGFSIASIQMVLEPLPVRELTPLVEVVPMTDERFQSFVEHSEAAFADDLVASGRYAREDAAAESRRQMRLELPQGLATPGQELFTASVDGAEVGYLWLGMRRRDGRPHAFVLDIEVAEDQRRLGYGRALMHAAEREARRLGADSLGLHVFGFNTGAIELYESLGYRRVEETFLLDL